MGMHCECEDDVPKRHGEEYLFVVLLGENGVIIFSDVVYTKHI